MIYNGEVIIQKDVITKKPINLIDIDKNNFNNVMNNTTTSSKSLMVDVTGKVTLVKLFRGQTFGEVALESKNSIRTASAVVSIPTLLLVLNRDDYITLTSSHKKIVYNGVYSLIQNNFIFKSWTKELLDRLVSTVKHQMFAPNTDIIKVGEQTKSFYIIKLGVVKLVKPVLKSALKLPTPKIKDNLQSSNLYSTTKSNKNNNNTSSTSSSMSITSNKSKNNMATSTPLASIKGTKNKSTSINNTTTNTTTTTTNTNTNTTSTSGRKSVLDKRLATPQSPREYSVAYKPHSHSLSSVLDDIPMDQTEHMNNTNTNNNDNNDELSQVSDFANNNLNLNDIEEGGGGDTNNNLSSILGDDSSTNYSNSNSVAFHRPESINTSRDNESLVDQQQSADDQLWVLEKNWRDSILSYDIENTRITTPSSYYDDESKKQVNNNDVAVNFTVSVLGAGQVFGELAILDHKIPSPISAISFTPVEVYAFDHEIFTQLEVRFMPISMQVLNEMMNLHNPPAEKLAYYFKEKLRWELKKSRVLQQIK